ncbi:hypothetical protein B0H11DRAFT_793541 [Mycena galericulata]|nr:hypothetical protein B0H11DRAFT_793541 [Mycena galericulata]
MYVSIRSTHLLPVLLSYLPHIICPLLVSVPSPDYSAASSPTYVTSQPPTFLFTTVFLCGFRLQYVSHTVGPISTATSMHSSVLL